MVRSGPVKTYLQHSKAELMFSRGLIVAAIFPLLFN